MRLTCQWKLLIASIYTTTIFRLSCLITIDYLWLLLTIYDYWWLFTINDYLLAYGLSLWRLRVGRREKKKRGRELTFSHDNVFNVWLTSLALSYNFFNSSWLRRSNITHGFHVRHPTWSRIVWFQWHQSRQWKQYSACSSATWKSSQTSLGPVAKVHLDKLRSNDDDRKVADVLSSWMRLLVCHSMLNLHLTLIKFYLPTLGSPTHSHKPCAMLATTTLPPLLLSSCNNIQHLPITIVS